MPFFIRLAAWGTLLTALLTPSTLTAAPVRPRPPTADFTAAELGQGYTNQSVLALPRPPADGPHDEQAEAA